MRSLDGAPQYPNLPNLVRSSVVLGGPVYEASLCGGAALAAKMSVTGEFPWACSLPGNVTSGEGGWRIIRASAFCRHVCALSNRQPPRHAKERHVSATRSRQDCLLVTGTSEDSRDQLFDVFAPSFGRDDDAGVEKEMVRHHFFSRCGVYRGPPCCK